MRYGQYERGILPHFYQSHTLNETAWHVYTGIVCTLLPSYGTFPYALIG
ncbi:hypothetical protein [Staphylococcus ratti]|uniref:Uncharacterized protein n=1 Tax=Staphylococcus ratti TaxID=2892440 RepID=A0ABY3PD69_9STAP|nr:hypothetical protein [Staphylococcus ratti]UEX90279.1 hypothetical protein LN051_00985 [Staphylococcus ratti]